MYIRRCSVFSPEVTTLFPIWAYLCPSVCEIPSISTSFSSSCLWKITYCGGPSNICSSHYSLLSCVWKSSEARRVNFWTIIFPTKEIIISVSLFHIKYLLFSLWLLRSMRELWARTRFFAGTGTAESRFSPPKSWEVEEDCHMWPVLFWSLPILKANGQFVFSKGGWKFNFSKWQRWN